MNVAFWDNKEKHTHIYKMKLYENQLGFFSQIGNPQNQKDSFRYEFIENCSSNYGRPENTENNKLFFKKCCISFKVNWSRDYSKKIDICSINQHPTICIVEIKNLEKTLINNCKKMVANRQYYEFNHVYNYQGNSSSNISGNTTKSLANNTILNSMRYNISNNSYVTLHPMISNNLNNGSSIAFPNYSVNLPQIS